jgi:hypothetical protein
MLLASENLLRYANDARSLDCYQSLRHVSVKSSGDVSGLRRIGRGLITLKLSAEGEMRVIKTIQDVISLWKEGADGKIVMVEDAGITTVGPSYPNSLESSAPLARWDLISRSLRANSRSPH